MQVLDLFSGIGGFSLGLERAGMKTVAFCEIDPFCQKVLKKHWPEVPIYHDIKQLSAESLRRDGITADLICGGFPCQPFSLAGKRKGKEDDRHLWPEMYRVIAECQPAWVIAENVPGLAKMVLDDCLFDLESLGYETGVLDIPACAVNAPHQRSRLWIIGHPRDGKSNRIISNPQNNRLGRGGEFPQGGESAGIMAHPNGNNGTKGGTAAGPSSRMESGLIPCGEIISDSSKFPRNERLNGIGYQEDREIGIRREIGTGESPVPDADSAGLQGRRIPPLSGWQDSDGYLGATGWRLTEPPLCGTDDGVSSRLDPNRRHRTARLKALGNAVVPQIPEILGRYILQIKNARK